MTTQSELEQRLLDFVNGEIFGGCVRLDVESDLVAAGFDSMSLVSLLLFVEREHGIWLQENEITAEVLMNIKSLAAHVQKHLQ